MYLVCSIQGTTVVIVVTVNVFNEFLSFLSLSKLNYFLTRFHITCTDTLFFFIDGHHIQTCQQHEKIGKEK